MGKIDVIIDEVGKIVTSVKEEIFRIVVGKEEVLNLLIKSLFSNGYVLLNGPIGSGKTFIIKALANAFNCDFRVIQFNPDSSLNDLVFFHQNTKLSKSKSPIIDTPLLTNFLIIKNLYLAPPKIKSFLLEVALNREVHFNGVTIKLPRPFILFGINDTPFGSDPYIIDQFDYSLNDTFLFSMTVDYPSVGEEQEIIRRTALLNDPENHNLKPILSPKDLLKLQEYTRCVYLDDRIERYISMIIDATRNPMKYGIRSGKYIKVGVSPRGSISLFKASKVDALMDSKAFVSPQHVKNVAFNVLNHRLVLNEEAKLKNIRPENVVKEILDKVPIP